MSKTFRLPLPVSGIGDVFLAMIEAQNILSRTDRFSNPRYYPLGSEKPHEFYEDLKDNHAALYEYIHYGNPDAMPPSLGRVFLAFAETHIRHMESLGIPYGSSTLRILKYPAQTTVPGVGSSLHKDFDFMTTIIAETVKRSAQTIDGYPLKSFYGNQAELYDPKRFPALIHSGRTYRAADRYAIVLFSVPPDDFMLTGDLSVADYYKLTQDVKY